MSLFVKGSFAGYSILVGSASLSAPVVYYHTLSLPFNKVFAQKFYRLIQFSLCVVSHFSFGVSAFLLCMASVLTFRPLGTVLCLLRGKYSTLCVFFPLHVQNHTWAVLRWVISSEKLLSFLASDVTIVYSLITQNSQIYQTAVSPNLFYMSV